MAVVDRLHDVGHLVDDRFAKPLEDDRVIVGQNHARSRHVVMLLERKLGDDLGTLARRRPDSHGPAQQAGHARSC